jgi:hypothetical protein
MYLGETDTSLVSRRQWWLLFNNQIFKLFWRRQRESGDTTDSAYEYHLAKACFCCGLNPKQTEAVILKWRREHGLTRDLSKLCDAIIPGAWREVAPWVEGWRAKRDAARKSKAAAKTSNRILEHIRSTNGPQTPSSIAGVLEIPRERAKKAMQRMAAGGKLVQTEKGYEIPTRVGTF